MKKYRVHFLQPGTYEIEAKNFTEAAERAVANKSLDPATNMVITAVEEVWGGQ
jgi:hypothetical protein